MNTRREFLFGVTAGLFLTATGAWAAGGNPVSPTDVVRAYLAARTRHDTAGQYALLSSEAQSAVPFAQFDMQFADAKLPLSNPAEDGVSPLLACVSVFFMDSHGHTGYQFTVLGPDPGDPKVILVQATPPGVSVNKAFLLKIATTTDSAGAARLEMLPSYQKTSSHDFEAMRNHAQDITSLSNLRQIGLALVMYPEAHEGRLPDADAWVDALLPWWKKTAQPDGSMFDPVLLFRDPSAPEGQRWNYAFNRALSGVKLADITNPGATVMLFESTTGIKNAADTGQSLPHPGRHAGGDYYVFASGHAQWFADGTKLSYRLDGK